MADEMQATVHGVEADHEIESRHILGEIQEEAHIRGIVRGAIQEEADPEIELGQMLGEIQEEAPIPSIVPGEIQEEAHIPSTSEHIPGEIQEVPSDPTNYSSVNAIVPSGSVQNPTPPPKPCLNKYAVGASIIFLLLGLDIGLQSEATSYIKKEKRTIDVQSDIVIAILHVISLLGSLFAGWISDRSGRRCTISLTCLFLLIGTAVTCVGLNNFMLLLGRGFTHFGTGFALMIAPVYIAEVSPARGLFTSLLGMFMDVGFCLGYVCNYSTSKADLNLGRGLLISLAIILLFMVIAVVSAMPESPRWLVMQGRLYDANLLLRKIFNSEEEAAIEFASLMSAAGIPQGSNNNIQVNMQRTGDGVWRDLIHPTRNVCHMLTCTLLIQAVQQLCGANVIILYSTRIFEKAGVTSANEKLAWTIAIYIVKTMLVLIPIFFLDRCGRRPLLLSSIGGMVVFLASLGTCLTIIDRGDTSDTWVATMCIASLLCYVAFFSIGVGPVTSLYGSEVFPLRLRAQGFALGVASNQLLSAVLSSTFVWLYRTITLGGSAFLFMTMAAIVWPFLYWIMPETQGQTPEELWRFFGRFGKWKSTAMDIEMQRIIEVLRRQ